MLCGAGVLAAARPPQVSAPPAFGVGLAARRNGPSRAVRRRAALPSVEVTPEIGAKAGLLAEWLSEAYDVIDYAEVLDKAAAESGCVDIDDEAEELVYGEFGMPLFCALIDGLEPSASTTFVDFGSGRGQLVLAAAKGWSWSRCVGVEILPELHHIANAVYASASSDTSPCMFYLGDMYTLMSEVMESATRGNESGKLVVFLYATKFQCLPPPDDDRLVISRCLAEALPSGATVITINKRLGPGDGFEMISEQTGPNPEGGTLTVYTWTRL